MGGAYSKFGVHAPFDPQYSLVTSPIYPPLVLALLRLLFGFYYLVYFIFKLSWDSVHFRKDFKESVHVQRPTRHQPLTRPILQILLLFHSLVSYRSLRLLLGSRCADPRVRALEEIPPAPLA